NDTIKSEHIDEEECDCRSEDQPAGQSPSDDFMECPDLYTLELHAEENEGKRGEPACQLLDGHEGEVRDRQIEYFKKRRQPQCVDDQQSKQFPQNIHK